MHDHVQIVLRMHLPDQAAVANIALIKLRPFVYRFPMVSARIIEYDHLMAAVDQVVDDHASYITCTACYKYCHMSFRTRRCRILPFRTPLGFVHFDTASANTTGGTFDKV